MIRICGRVATPAHMVPVPGQAPSKTLVGLLEPVRESGFLKQTFRPWSKRRHPFAEGDIRLTAMFVIHLRTAIQPPGSQNEAWHRHFKDRHDARQRDAAHRRDEGGGASRTRYPNRRPRLMSRYTFDRHDARGDDDIILAEASRDDQNCTRGAFAATRPTFCSRGRPFYVVCQCGRAR